MPYTEQALLLHCQGDAMVGVLSRPDKPAAQGVVVVVGGPQYRAGSHRQFVLLARCLAAAGYPVLRFDYRGMGDSGGEVQSFESIDKDIATAIDALLQACPELQGVVLWGLCDGASAALLYCGVSQDARVQGLCLLNPWVRSEATLARTHLKHHYAGRLLSPDFWNKLRTGQIQWKKSLRDLFHNLRSARSQAKDPASESPFQVRMAQALRQFPGSVLLLLSGNDYTAREFLEAATSDSVWKGLLNRPGLTRVEVEGADHTFSRQQWRHAAEQAVVQWMGTLKP